MSDTPYAADFPVHLFEEHSSSLPIWWQTRKTPCTLVYLDAHLDLQQLSEAQIDALKQAQTLSQVKALESPHHLNISSHYAFGIENFLYAAQRLKLIKRLIWAVPPHIPRRYSASLLEYMQQMDGVTFTELSSFKPIGDGALRGQLLGLDITLCDYQALHSLNLPQAYYLDIDIDYFVAVPEDRLWVDPQTVINSLLQQLGDPQLVTISRAVGSGFTPLPMRFIGDYCAALVTQNRVDSDHFHCLYQSLGLIERQPHKALQYAQQAVQARPACAASQFMLSIALQHTDQHNEANCARDRAIELNPHYAFELGRAASGFPNRHREINSAQIEALRSQLNRHSSAEARISLALLLAEQGALTPATQLFESLPGDYKNHAPLALEIARGMLSGTAPSKARPLLDIAATAPATRTTANMLLGDLALHEGDMQRALNHYSLAAQFAPAWLQPLQQQLRCYETINDATQQLRLKQIIQARQQALLKLVDHNDLSSTSKQSLSDPRT